MATRSRIGIELKDGSVLSVYHHWDGYPEWLGRILNTHYNTRQQVSELIDGGDMSCCWTDERWDDSGVKGVYGPQYYSQRGEEFAYVYTQSGDWLCYDTCDWHDSYLEGVEIPSGALAV
jgi:hypothetical protein